MSFNHSRSDKSDSQYRKSGRSAGSNQQRTSSGAYGKGGGGGPALSPSSSSTSSNRSFKKSDTAHGGQSRVNIQAATSSDIANSSAHRHVQNGAQSQPPLHGVSDAPVSTGTSKPIETPSTQRNTRTAPKAPTSQSASLSTGTASPVTPTKRPGDASKAFPFQFGSISPGFMNGMQIPARTSSAPPNLDEQKCDQARNDSFQPAPPVPIPAPKQQLPRKDMGSVDQSNAGDAYPVRKARKDIQVSAALPVSQTQKPSVLPIPMTSMQMPFHQSPVSLQFGGPNSQIQTQGVPPTSLQVPMPMTALPMGSAPQVQQAMFVPGLQPHPMQPQGIMHQGQGLAFAPQMGPQLSPQLGNLRIGISSQYPQQQGGKFGGQRKTTVKITDPKTHEELRLDKHMDMYTDSGSSGLRSHPNMPPQPQPIPSYAPTRPINYYPNSYNNLFFQPSSALPLTGGQIAPNSQPPRFNYSVSQGLQNASIVNPSTANSLPKKSEISTHAMAETSSVKQMRDAHNMISSASSGTVQVKVKSANSTGEKVVDSLSSNSSSAVDKELTSKLSGLSVEGNSSPVQKDTENVDDSSLHHSQPGTDSSASKLVAVVSGQPVPIVVNKASNSVSLPPPFPSEESVVVGGCAEGGTKESLSRSNSVKGHQKKLGKKGYIQSHQIGGQSTLVSSAPSCTKEQSISSNSGSSDSADTKTTLTSSSMISEAFIDSVPTIGNSAPDVSKAKVNNDDTSCVRAETASPRGVIDSLQSMDDGIKREDKSSVISSVSICSGSVDQIDQSEKESSVIDEVRTLERVDEPAASNIDVDRVPNNTDAYTSRELKSTDIEKSHVDDNLVLDELSTKVNSVDSAEVPVTKSSPSDQQFSPVSNPDHSESRLKLEGENIDNSGGGLGSIALSSSKDRVPELTRTSSTTSRLKKKRKEILQKADAAGTTSDLYMAYKGPEEKKENASSSEVVESASASSKQAMTDPCTVDSVVSEIGLENKVEPEDWEDAADISTPKPETSDNREQFVDKAKKYSRDFLLKFSDQCTELPPSFEITSDIADALMTVNISQFVERESFPSPGRVMDKSNSGSRMDRRGSGIANDDRWSKLPFSIARDLLVDVGFGVNVGFRPGQGGNYGVLRNPRTQAPIHYAGGILSGPMQAMGSQGGMQRNNPDAERWQRATNFQQKGLIPSPQTPLQIMHKAERKYEVGKITDEEEAKQRQLKAILNKLTPQNFEKLFEQVKAVNIDNAVTLTGVISQIFDKALMEPTFCEMYANFCYHLAGELPDFTEDNERITFKRLLLNKCQEEFERGEREQEEANKVDEEGEIKQSTEEREEKRTNARRRMLGNIRLIGELYKKKMLTERIMHECIKKLLGQYQNPDEEDVEALCKLMSTIGEMIDHPKAKEHMDAYFDWMAKLSNSMKLSSRVRFMLKDAIDLRKNKWQQRRKVEGPKKIDEVHRDAAQERHHQTGRLSRNPTTNPSLRRAPMDLGPKGSSMIFSPNAQMGGFHGFSTQVRGFGNQDVRFDERQLYDARNLSVPLSRPLGEDSITLGPQGGLARGSISGPTAMTSNSLADIPPSQGDSRRMGAGSNGFSAAAERQAYSPREDFVPRDLRTQDHSFDGPLETSLPGRAQPPALAQNTPFEKIWPEEQLRDMSLAAIKEFYSARDEGEVALCIKDLNSSSFHPSMISLWVTDSFERKDVERDVLAKLLVNLVRSQDATLTSSQLVKGFELVLTTLEDAVNDAPKAAEFLGRMFGEVVIENVVALREIGQLLYKGGEEPGRLLEIGLAGDVLGSILEMIRTEKGECVLNEIRNSSNLCVEDFRPPNPYRSRILEKFIK